MLLAVLAVLAVTGETAPPLTHAAGVAVIERSASTNRRGFAIAVMKTGAVAVHTESADRHLALAASVAAHFYADIARAGALGSLPAGHCMKSVSFGTTTTIVYGGQRSPDLQCARNSIERALAADANEISALARPDAGPRRPIIMSPRSVR